MHATGRAQRAGAAVRAAVDALQRRVGLAAHHAVGGGDPVAAQAAAQPAGVEIAEHARLPATGRLFRDGAAIHFDGRSSRR